MTEHELMLVVYCIMFANDLVNIKCIPYDNRTAVKGIDIAILNRQYK